MENNNNDNSTISFSDITFIHQQGGLNNNNILEYFYRSNFYNNGLINLHNINIMRSMENYEYLRTQSSVVCNNETLRIQNYTGSNVVNILLKMKGFQFINEQVNSPINQSNPYFIIRKIYRYSPTHFDTIDLYYCINGIFYKSPELFEIVHSKFHHINEHIKTAFHEIVQSVNYLPSKGEKMISLDQKVEVDEFLSNKRNENFEMIDFPSMNNVLKNVDEYVNSLITTNQPVDNNISNISNSEKLS